jgi:hypothetical protein
MKISAGISEIALPSAMGKVRSEKIFIWPRYNSGRVYRTRGVAGKTKSSVVYSKPAMEDHFKLLAFARNSHEIAYSAAGRTIVKNPSAYQPGSFFDALV